MSQLIFDLAGGMAARDAGIEQVLRRSDARHKLGWSDYAVAGIRLFSRNHSEFTTEEFRAWWDCQGGADPHHVNAWGAVFRKAACLGVIRGTGRFVKSSHVAAHARVVQLWSAA
jgi:hypothetical protein